jgi:periplasmic divalent cation tolerance protein
MRKTVARDFLIVFVTAASEEEAATIGKALVEDGLAACANIIPTIRSIYRWKGAVWDEKEALMIIKSRAELFERVSSRVKELHSYEVPEITAVKLEKGDPAYLLWMETVIAKGD